MKKTIHFVSLGCPKNRVDTEVMLGVSDLSGYRHVDDPAAAEVIVVNTCGFIDAAKQESIDTVLSLSDMKQQGSCRTLVVSGCLSQRYPEQLAEGLPEVDHFLGSSDMLALGRVLRGEARERMMVGNPADYIFRLGDPRSLSQGQASAYVKIAEGCSRQCSFCAIPSFRGKQRSRPVDDVVGEVRRLTEAGTNEINLISQDTVSYGRDLPGGRQLLELLDALEEVESLRWLRLFYLYPEALPDALLERFGAGGRLLPYVDMPMQHATDAMLRRMRRGYDAARQRTLVERLRQAAPGVSIRTAFIVGHPGETEADFEALCALVRWAEFDHVGVFRYSDEEGTHSHTLGEPVDEETIAARAEALSEIQREISRKRLAARVGQELEVLVEGVSEESELLLQGRHAGQAPEVDGVVLLTHAPEGEPPRAGDLRRALVTQSADYDLVAELLPLDGDGTPRPGSRRLRVMG
ncbi:MAG: 30S ribosomal protein S12 methylthiotransferase RimO [Myxococcales bacterium]